MDKDLMLTLMLWAMIIISILGYTFNNMLWLVHGVIGAWCIILYKAMNTNTKIISYIRDRVNAIEVKVDALHHAISMMQNDIEKIKQNTRARMID